MHLLLPEFQPWFLQLFQVIGNLSIVVAIIAAAIGYSAWRREHTERARYDLARRLILDATGLRSELRELSYTNLVFDPLTFNKTSEIDEQHRQEECERYKQHIGKVDRALDQLRTARWETNFVMQKDLKSAISAFDILITTFSIQILTYFTLASTLIGAIPRLAKWSITKQPSCQPGQVTMKTKLV